METRRDSFLVSCKLFSSSMSLSFSLTLYYSFLWDLFFMLLTTHYWLLVKLCRKWYDMMCMMRCNLIESVVQESDTHRHARWAWKVFSSQNAYISSWRVRESESVVVVPWQRQRLTDWLIVMMCKMYVKPFRRAHHTVESTAHCQPAVCMLSE